MKFERIHSEDVKVCTLNAASRADEAPVDNFVV
jgi:hypothetical protein